MKLSRIFLALSICLLSISSFAQERKHTTFYEQRATLFELLPVDSTAVVFLGNSITNGCEWHELLKMPNAVNRGISGDIVEGIEDRLAPVVDGHPAKIFLMIGVNDVSHNLTADSIATSIITLVDHIRSASPQTKLYVQSLLPIDGSYGKFKNIIEKDEVIRDVNAALPEAIKERGATWIDLYTSFADENGHLRSDLTNDGLHLLGSGYALWREIILPYVNE